MRVTFGDAPVPWTVAWSSEDAYYIDRCPDFGVLAICQKEEAPPHSGRPLFGNPHNNRLRRALARGLCDLCARPLKSATKISLTAYLPGVRQGDAIRQVEPLLHTGCAHESIRYCPALRRQLREGRLGVRQVYQWRAWPLEASEDHIRHALPGYNGPRPLLGTAVIELLSWRDVTAAWVGAA